MHVLAGIRRVSLRAPLALLGVAATSAVRASAQQIATPLRQSALDSSSARAEPLSLRDASRKDRWLGVGARDLRWAPDGSAVYFRWNRAPKAEEDSAADPWFRVDRSGTRAEQLPDSLAWRVPAARPSWSRDGRRAAWSANGSVILWDATSARPSLHRILAAATDAPRHVRFADRDRAVDFMQGEDLYRYDLAAGELRRLTRRHARSADQRTDAQRWLVQQQLDLFQTRRDVRAQDSVASVRRRAADPYPVQAIPAEEGVRLDDVQLSPDNRWLTFRWIREEKRRPVTHYLDYVTASGYAEVRDSHDKAGEPRDEEKLGILRYDPAADPDRASVIWATSSDAGSRPVVIHAASWSLEGDRAVVQISSQDGKDLWIGALEAGTGVIRTIDHQRDSAWLGGPPVLAQRLQPALLEWLPGGRFVFASERSGWSHLYLAGADGVIQPLTSGTWEVRAADLSRDRSHWLIGASREHPSDDALYLMPAAGGALVPVATTPGRHAGSLSPDGQRLAEIYSETIQLPDLLLRDARAGAPAVRVTASGTDNFFSHRWTRPRMVSFPHPDGKPLYAALFAPEKPNAEHAAVMHVHGGGYRQFSHRGWSVYGYNSHLGIVNYLVQQGYTVLDFDYRGGAGYGRDYRAGTYRDMGYTDVDGAVGAVDWLAKSQGVDRTRVGVFGVSYGGFFTLAALFNRPGLFAAGIANAAVSDWAHYTDVWTTPILNRPFEDPEAYRRTSPIYHADGLKDPLLIVHGLVDDNVHFQDAARLVQRLIELEKPFEVMYYPTERHVIASESSRLDFNKRLLAFFDRHLLRRPEETGAGTSSSH
ncbi:MAG: prolyl oligopeptidase family serine peptidase [Gemmatimonadota bacterium]|nr:prolyl oligopeptidase family serine peptidase [Gemmatimonadota bacterium]